MRRPRYTAAQVTVLLTAESCALTAYNCWMLESHFVVRPAETRDDEAIAGLVVEGFVDKFRPVFGRRMDRSVKIMEKWIRLEHASSGVTSLVIEGYAPGEIAGSVEIGRASCRERV